MDKIEIFLFIFVRVLAFMVVSPIFARRSIPVYTKIGFSLLFAYMVFVYNNNADYPHIGNFISLTYYLVKEMIAGMIIGYITTLAFSAILTAGQLIDTQIGFGMSNVYDPQMNIQVPLIGNLKNLLSMLFFFMINGHHTLFMLLAESFYLVTPGMVKFEPGMALGIVDIFIRMFILAFKIALPMIAGTFLCEAALGLLVRVVPQMNVFVIGIPLKIIVGLFILYISIPFYIRLLNGLYSGMYKDISNIIHGMIGQ